MSATTALFRNEARLFSRTPAAFIWVALPVLAAVVIAAIPAARQPNDVFGGLSVSEAYTPTLTMFAITMVALVLLPQLLGEHRELGFLRRLRTTPASAADLLKAFLALMTILCLGSALLIAVVPLLFGVPGPESPLGHAFAIVLSTAAFLALGTVLSAVIPNPKAASGIGTAVAVTQWFSAGMWYPRAQFPDWLVTLTNLMPGGAATELMTNAMTRVSTGSTSVGGSTSVLGSTWGAVAVCVAWTVLGIAVALKTFRWE